MSNILLLLMHTHTRYKNHSYNLKKYINICAGQCVSACVFSCVYILYVYSNITLATPNQNA